MPIEPGWLQRQINSTANNQCALCGSKSAKSAEQPEYSGGNSGHFSNCAIWDDTGKRIKDSVCDCGGAITIEINDQPDGLTVHQLVEKSIKERGYTGLCSAHKNGENPTCQTCYPAYVDIPIKHLIDAFEKEYGDTMVNLKWQSNKLAAGHGSFYEDRETDDMFGGFCDGYQLGYNAALATKRESGTPTIADYEATLADHRRLVRELDVALNGDDAAQQASLCDIVSQVKSMRRESGSDNG